MELDNGIFKNDKNELQLKSRTYLYMYRMTDDSGLAPCVEKGLLTLACCKGGQLRNGKPVHTGLRYRIGSQRDGADPKTDNVYILGTYKNRLLYLARVTEAITMEKYYDGRSKGRTDDIYSLINGGLVRNAVLRKQDVHTDPDRVIRDIAGKYVLLSRDFIYLGRDAVYLDIIQKYNARFRETKLYTGNVAEAIVAECLKYRDGKRHQPTKPIKKTGGCG